MLDHKLRAALRGQTLTDPAQRFGSR